LASGCGQTIRVWDLEGEADPVVIARAHGQEVISVAFAVDGKTLISGGHRLEEATKELGRPVYRSVSEVRVWDAATGKLLRELKAEEPAKGWCSIALSMDGKLLASTHQDRLRIWDLMTGKPVRDLTDYRNHYGARTQDLAFSPDGKLLAAGGGDNAV